MNIKEFKVQYAIGSLTYDDLLEMARNTTSKKILVILSEDKNPWIRGRVAGNTYTPMDVLLNISKAECNVDFIKSVARRTIKNVKTVQRRARKRQNRNSK